MAPLVTISCGQLRGIEERGVIAFKGIPYAAPPVGVLRFRPPQKPIPWKGFRDATTYGSVPFQHPMGGAFGALATPVQPQAHDSLVLNVWTPDPAASGLPVLMWIHGGAYYAGSGSDAMYNGARFARDGVVCVTTNYRLGVEGFLYLGHLFEGFEESGCNGIADQLAALQWVKENIAAFGGDPTNVTIAGESAGASSVTTLMALPRARGTFHRAIVQSGSQNVISTAQAGHTASIFLSRAGVPPGDLGALQELSAERVVAVQQAMTGELMGTPDQEIWKDISPGTIAFRPTFGTAFLPQKPLEAIAEGSARDVDLLVGSNADETLIFIRTLGAAFVEDVVRKRLSTMMTAAGKSGVSLFELYRSNYPDAPSHIVTSAVDTDRRFRIPAIRLAETQASQCPNVYMYRFDWRSNAFDGEMGAFHILEVPFVFDNLEDQQSQGFTGPAPKELADAMHGAWVAFAKSGIPRDNTLPSWPRYDLQRRSTMLFDLKCKVVDDPNSTERRAWNNVVF